ncbi:hypothetical protein [Burkholderia gladioli]|uniref:DUF1871 family protein n=1 Tax=Burkholderia gladioli (strain BSR3) TaxID=999541 RepID=F2LTG2_BURGS|nr:hypothetical protein [Burkholderia gladioli]AEA66108.1 hypothetical protein bgla_4p3630 [Burkholderia gladioli BSR3]MBW5287607.1 hypothetical protein [Burkholderia gladioli]
MNSSTNALEIEVHKILLQEWDPIGIQSIPEAQNEYDSYVLGICKMLGEGLATEKLYEHLRWIESEHMGLDGDEHHTGHVAKKLANLLK